ncbi:hypothetical protein TWF694_010076 [Orbilia ellipsospora]|uniref:Uncharacterized protein n=1 Tax=Orbilia ellipsospora TaxID=2528407 RepID=A0AAV9X8T1_9PEZI
MLCSTIFSAAAFLLASTPFVAAAPAAAPLGAELQERSVGVSCVYYQYPVDYVYRIWVYNDKSVDTSCGQGFLDNFHGRGCTVTGWTCNYNGPDAYLQFQTDLFCGPDDIQAAIQAASYGTITTCNYGT